jgi:TIR domain
VSYAFLSYKSEDRQIAKQLADALRARGIAIWMDIQVLPGQDFQAELDLKLREASAIVVLWTKLSVKSEWVKSEAMNGLHRNILVPIVADPEARTAIPFQFSNIHYLELDERRDRLERLVDELMSSLARLGVGPSTIQQSIESSSYEDQQTTDVALPTEKTNKGFAFLSYCEEDAPFRDAMINFLKQKGYAYWEYDSGDRNYDTLTFLELEENILRSSLMLAVLSPDWKRSAWVIKEYYFAKENRKPVFLLRYRDPGPTLAIAGETYIDFVESHDRGFQKLEKELRRKGL